MNRPLALVVLTPEMPPRRGNVRGRGQHVGGVDMHDRNAHRRAKRERAIRYLGGACVRCGASDELHFDHVDPKSKSGNISTLLDWRWSRLVVELDKCQLLCPPCHQEKGFEDGTVAQHARRITRWNRRPQPDSLRRRVHERLTAEGGVPTSTVASWFPERSPGSVRSALKHLRSVGVVASTPTYGGPHETTWTVLVPVEGE